MNRSTDADQSNVLRRTIVIAAVLACLPAPASGAARPAPPNDPRFGEQWGLLNAGQLISTNLEGGLAGADVRGLEAWQWTKGAGAPPLAVVDTGVDFTHPDMVGAAWTNPGETAGNGIDDDQNGFIDDVHGWNFLDDHENNDTRDPNSHGTNVASVAAARANDGIGMAGLAPETDVMPLVVTDADGYGGATNVAEAILYAGRNGARVANLSLGQPSAYAGATMDVAIRQVPNLLIVAAAGNRHLDNDSDAEASWPCASDEPNVICVGATDANDKLTGFSHYGARTVDMAAPGDYILNAATPVVGGEITDHTYGLGSGTSLATPMVAATAQLLLAMRPDLTTAQLRDALLETGVSLASLAGKTVTGRRLDAARALEMVVGPAPVAPTPAGPAHVTPPTPSRHVPHVPAATAAVPLVPAPSQRTAAAPRGTAAAPANKTKTRKPAPKVAKKAKAKTKKKAKTKSRKTKTRSRRRR